MRSFGALPDMRDPPRRAGRGGGARRPSSASSAASSVAPVGTDGLGLGASGGGGEVVQPFTDADFKQTFAVDDLVNRLKANVAGSSTTTFRNNRLIWLHLHCSALECELDGCH